MAQSELSIDEDLKAQQAREEALVKARVILRAEIVEDSEYVSSDEINEDRFKSAFPGRLRSKNFTVYEPSAISLIQVANYILNGITDEEEAAIFHGENND